MRHPISTFPRFMYLNAYAFLLLLVGTGIALIPCYEVGWWLVAIQVIGAIVCLRVAWRIFATWNDKKRKYDLLMQRNANEWRPDTFNEFMHAPCGRLLTILVLKDMGHPERYKELKRMGKPLWQQMKENCGKQETRVWINE